MPTRRRLSKPGKSRRFSGIAQVATRRLAQLDNAHELRDLGSPPGNRLEALRGDRAGQHRANALAVPAPRVNDIVRERRGVTADTALRLARYFDTMPQFWLNLQTA